MITITLNSRLQPVHRYELEDIIDNFLKTNNLGEINGGGTFFSKDGEPMSADISIQLNEMTSKNVEKVLLFLNKLSVPKGSKIKINKTGEEFEIGTLEGLSLSLNGIDLPNEVYIYCDVNVVVEKAEQAMKAYGSMHSYHTGNEYTSLYFYGTSFDKMKSSLKDLLIEYPLCRECKIEKIA